MKRRRGASSSNASSRPGSRRGSLCRRRRRRHPTLISKSKSKSKSKSIGKRRPPTYHSRKKTTHTQYILINHTLVHTTVSTKMYTPMTSTSCASLFLFLKGRRCFASLCLCFACVRQPTTRARVRRSRVRRVKFVRSFVRTPFVGIGVEYPSVSRRYRRRRVYILNSNRATSRRPSAVCV